MRLPRFTVGQRVISAPGLHWMPLQRTGTVILDNGHDGIVVLLDDPCSRGGSRDKRRLFLTYKNVLPLEATP